MRNINTKATCFITILFLSIIVSSVHVQCRSLPNELISNGVDDDVQSSQQDSYLLLNNNNTSNKFEDSNSGEYCKQMYGFLPCSNNIFGHLFLILVYEYLLFHGESYLAAGGEQIFKILGPGVFGASAFDILGALPESLILLVTGLSSDKESAQEYASTGVGLLAGSSILLLTVVWGTCVIVGKQSLKNDSISVTSYSSTERIKQSLIGYGITMDVDTRKMARNMVFSIIPLLIMQFPTLFHFSTTLRSVTLMISLIIAVTFLISYFIYQIFKPQIEKTRLEYIKHDDLILRIFQRVEKQTLQKILAEDGTPNVTAISGLYSEFSQRGEKHLSALEVKELLLGNNLTGTNIREDQINDMLKAFDKNGDQIITKEEFVSGLTEYINQTKHALDRKYLPKESMNKMYQTFIKPWIEHTRKERALKLQLISGVLDHAQNDMVGRLLKDDGTPDKDAIKRLFGEVDSDGSNNVSRSELEKIVKETHFGRGVDSDEAVTKLLHDLDVNKDDEISENEFVDGFTKWLNSNSNQAASSKSSSHEPHQTWEEVEKVMEGNQTKGVSAWLEALAYVFLGIIMLSLLAEPLIHSVQNFSEAAGISSFFISFIIVPLATNFREATSAIKEASHKKSSNTSHTMYEIYGAVFMNNILGFVVISSLIYMRDITWEFSADVLVVAIVCIVMGLTASFRSTFPLWTSIPTYILYLISLVLVYVLKDVLNYV
ncbi:sodium/calcium exchanger NCL-like [Trifolium pratense]|uniref:sodium/calcium exchanger NCL-like n=1 Tax=Trifolium pratense TaxID=57577 RepID=UPI001E691B32|nr:sodium/calcium exchanger NCL-like [Trifolium pratense]